MRVLPCALLAVAATACSTAVLPPGSVVPPLASDPILLAQVETSDGVGPRVWLTNGFGGGAPITYWEMGLVGTDRAMPLYVLCRTTGSRCEPLAEHPRVAAWLPGDADYTPFSRIYEVPVTAAYAGEVLPSAQAVRDAVASGLVEEPVPTLFYIELVLVHPDTSIEVGPDMWVPPNASVYVQGLAVPAVDFSPTHPRLRVDNPERGTILVRNVYILTRDGETMPLNERARGMDLTNDGDQSDANSVLGATLSEADYTPLWEMILVTVPASYASIDTSMDQDVADYRSATDMFTIAPDYSISPIAERVVAFDATGMLVNCPVQSAPGAL